MSADEGSVIVLTHSLRGSGLRVGLNLLHALPEIGGGWNYIENLLRALAECGGGHNYVAYTTKASERLVPTQGNFLQVRVNLESVNRPKRVIYENTVLQVLARRHGLDCMHWFGNVQALANSVPAVVTVYDLRVLSDPRSVSLLKRIYLQVMIRITAKRASVLLPISWATARDLQRR